MPRKTRRGRTNVGSRMHNKQHSCCKKQYFPTVKDRRDKNTNRGASSRADRSLENKGISLLVENIVRHEIYLRLQRTNHGSIPIHYEKTRKQREVTKDKINQ